jgi:hypothetical protein
VGREAKGFPWSKEPGRERVSLSEASEETAMDAAALAELLREAEEHHARYEPGAPEHHWWDWYAAYIVARQQGRSPDEAYHHASGSVDGARRPST